MDESQRADLHAHTTCSDGLLSPTELVDAAATAGLQAIAITDHDTVAGIAEATGAAATRDIELIPGIEISTRAGNREVHLLGLFIRPDSPPLVEVRHLQREWRRERAAVIIERAIQLGLDIDQERVDASASGAPIGRPHLAQVLVDSGHVATTQEAFDRYLGVGRPCFVPKRMVDTVEGIGVIHAAGGVAVVAHPGSSRVGQNKLTTLHAAGLDGVEVVHPRHPSSRQHLLRGLCGRLGLLPSGGSDYHGPGRGDSILGEHSVPMNWCDELRRRAAERRAAQRERE